MWRSAAPRRPSSSSGMVSNEVVSLEPGEARPALLLTPKSRIVAPLRVVREGPESFLLITEAALAETRRARPCCARASRPSARSSSSRTAATCSSARARGSATTTTASRPTRAGPRRSARPPSPDERARAAADRGRHARLGPRARRDDPPRRGRARRDARLLHQGLLPRPGADRAAALPRAPEPPAAGARGRCREPGRRDLPRREGCRPRHERRPRKGARLRQA